MSKVMIFYLFILMSLSKCCKNNLTWKDPDGFTCYYYELKRICSKNTGYYYTVQYYAGYSYNFPELNCCYCGKTDIQFY